MTFVPRERVEKHCFTYCGPERCDCIAGDDMAMAASLSGQFCEGCPPAGYPTDETRRIECPRRTTGVL